MEVRYHKSLENLALVAKVKYFANSNADTVFYYAKAYKYMRLQRTKSSENLKKFTRVKFQI